ncbi:MAG: hypothetical protein QHJ73_05400, partial [Armatimonadota bacterium]|nr:hypothetical protein [Armatimonadota bacterium]
MQLTPAAPSPLVGVVGMPELAAVLRKAGYDVRVVAPEEVDVGALDAYGLLLLNLERPLTLTGAAFLRDFVQRGGRLIACSWGPAVSPRLQPAFPVYRLQEVLQIRVLGWSAVGNAYLRSANGAGLFRGVAEF